MKRREFITLVGGAAVWPVLAWGQQGKVWRIGFLSQRHLDLAASDYYYGPFTQGLRELGYIEGRNLVVEWRSAEGKSERLPDLASDLARLKLDVLATAGTPAALAAKKAASTTPIVMIGVADPLGSGLVKSLARPGGNSTALSIMAAELGPKLLEILLGMSPKITSVAFLVNTSNPEIGRAHV